MAVLRNEKGQWLPGQTPNPAGRPKKGSALADLIKLEFGRDIEVLIDGMPTKMERRQIMADGLAQLISTGEVKLPDRMDADGNLIPGKVFKYTSDDWMKHLIRLFRYIEPPVTNIEVAGGVEGIIFDKEIGGEQPEE